MAWIKFSKYTRLSSQEKYVSRVWYQLSSKKAEELHALYPASSEIVLKGEPDWDPTWMRVDNPEISGIGRTYALHIRVIVIVNIFKIRVVDLEKSHPGAVDTDILINFRILEHPFAVAEIGGYLQYLR